MAAPVSVGELLRAWWAVQRGDFRQAPPVRVRGDGETQVLVVGAAGQVGASTIALAVAEASTAGRLLDCAPTMTSGLVGACDRELGRDGSGWWQGRRGPLLVQRSPLQAAAAPDAVPAPPSLVGMTSVLDPGFDVVTLAASRGWLADLLRDAEVEVVLVGRCTVPGLARIAAALDVLQPSHRQVRLAVVGPARGRWPRGVLVPPAVSALEGQDRLVCVPHVDALALSGLGLDPLPAPVLAAVNNLVKEGTLS